MPGVLGELDGPDGPGVLAVPVVPEYDVGSVAVVSAVGYGLAGGAVASAVLVE